MFRAGAWNEETATPNSFESHCHLLTVLTLNLKQFKALGVSTSAQSECSHTDIFDGLIHTSFSSW